MPIEHLVFEPQGHPLKSSGQTTAEVGDTLRQFKRLGTPCDSSRSLGQLNTCFRLVRGLASDRSNTCSGGFQFGSVRLLFRALLGRCSRWPTPPLNPADTGRGGPREEEGGKCAESGAGQGMQPLWGHC
jgi:hypothetical protein